MWVVNTTQNDILVFMLHKTIQKINKWWDFFPIWMEENKCRTKGQKSCGPTKERKTCSWFDKNVEENYDSWKKPKKPMANNKININKNMTQLTYEVW
jgi:hypothetical protein